MLSILIGVNDVWRDIDSAAGISAASYETLYALMLREFREALPEGKLLLLEPFVLPGSATTPHWETFSREVRLRAEAVRRLAERFGAVFVPLQQTFDEACRDADSSVWIWDGVHPTAAGYTLITREWLRAFQRLSF